MAITREKLETAVSLGFYNEIKLWGDNQKDALDHADAEVMPLLGGAPPFFKAAAWLNFGLDGTEKLFPQSALAQGIKKLTIPIAAANYAVEGFNALYRNEMEKSNALLRKDYNGIRDQFRDTIDQTILRDFINTPFSAAACKTLVSVFSKHLNELADEHMAMSHCQGVIREAGLIESSSEAIRERTAEGFGAICRKVRDIYRGTGGIIR